MRIDFPAIACVILTLIAVPSAAAHPAGTLVVETSSTTQHVVAPLPAGVVPDPARAWRLIEVDHPDVTIPVQLVPAVTPDGTVDPARRQLAAAVPPRDGANAPRRFRLEPADAPAPEPSFTWHDASAASLELREGDRPVLVYNHGAITNDSVPAADVRRTRACYFHPVHGLNGEVLTDDFPRDHYHHHGVFWAWPHVGIDGKQYDLWIGRGIRIERVDWLGRAAGPACAVLGVENGWFVGDKKVMIERVWLWAHREADGAQALDLQMAWIPVDRPIALRGAEGKSYGGLTIRFAVAPRERTTITVPDGVAKADLPETRLAWADLTKQFTGVPTPSGAAVMISPHHPDYPPMWLTRHYGPLCVGYPGIESKTFTPEKPLLASYRIWIHKTPADLARLKEAYRAYTAGAKVAWE